MALCVLEKFNMFNIDRELEISGTNWQFTSIDLDVSNEERLYVRYTCEGYRDAAQFCRQTGVLMGHLTLDRNLIRLRAKTLTEVRDRFHLTTGHQDWARTAWIDIADLVFDSGKEAAEQTRIMNADAKAGKWRYAVRKSVEDSPVCDYQSWAAERFETGEWTPAPWADQEWANRHPHHFVHLSLSDNGKIAYWEHVRDAQREVVTVTTPGRYLTAFFKDVLTPNQIRDYAVLCDPPGDLEFYDTQEGMVGAYVEAKTGCMQYPDGRRPWLHTQRNPVRVYAAGDLMVAILRRHGKAAARALVWPDKKACGRIYGDIERMTTALTELGYSFDNSNHNMEATGQGLFEGARLLKIPVEGLSDNFMMPYVDFRYKIKNEDSEEFLYMTMNSGYDFAWRTDGILCDPEEEVDDDCITCNNCEGDIDEDDVLTSASGNHYCSTCYNERFSNCHNCSTEINIRSDSYIVDCDGDRWCPDCSDRNLTSCDYCDEYVMSENTVTVYDARHEDMPHTDACAHCAENDDRIMRMTDGTLVDAETASHCDEHDHAYSGNDSECPVHSVEENVT